MRAKTVKEGGKIVGGIQANDGDFPWQVSIYNAAKTPSSGHHCGGTLISAEWVVTAAHCFNDGLTFRVYVGSQDLLTGGTSYEVERVIVHEAYDQFTSDNDIALMRLGRAVAQAETRSAASARATPKPASLIAPAETAKLASPSEVAIVTGWGSTVEKGAGTTALQMIEAPLIAREACNAPGKYDGQVTDNMLCAGGQGKDSCQGDSGGPLMLAGNDGRLILAGVVSWGEGCAKEDFPGIYTNVSKYLDWIRQKTGSGQTVS